MNGNGLSILVLAFAVAGAPAAAFAQSSNANPRAREALSRLNRATRGAAVAAEHRATGVSRFVRLAPGSAANLAPSPARTAREQERVSTDFFRAYGAALGVDDPTALQLVSTKTDRSGGTHLTFQQLHGAVPVFGGTVKTHFDAAGRLRSVNGTALPDLTVNESPIWSSEDAADVAHRTVSAERANAPGLGIGSNTLYVYRTGLAQGVPGTTHLAWEVEVTDGVGIRELVYVDAHTGKIIDRVAGIHDAMYRRAFDGHHFDHVPVNYPNGAFWFEGRRFPTPFQEANNMIVASQEVYDLFADAFDRDSFDGEGAVMDAIFDRGYSCPNASWNGTFISFCPGTTTDDVTAHEWGHAYTQYTHGLIYAWQPGALNESYSDIWGEVIDFINGRGSDEPGGVRSNDPVCSTFSPPVGQLHVSAPAEISGDYFAQSAGFGEPLTSTGPIDGEVVLALDGLDPSIGDASTMNGCTAITNEAEVAGRIALVYRGACEFSRKVLNAQNAGAIAVIIANNSPTGLPGMGAGADAPLVTIPSLGVQQSTGLAIQARLEGGDAVLAILRASEGTDESLRWLVGEDATAFGGAIRDMWNPTCHSNPAKVSDTAFYHCDGNIDNGGVHINSGVPNHAFALLVDGGTYNGQTVRGLGLTKAAHLYFHAQNVYQHPASDFADHADALEASCADLVGVPLPSLTGAGPGATFAAEDCAEVAKAIAAVELRTPPTFCGFRPMLNPDAPPLCGAGGTAEIIEAWDFEGSAPAGWTATHAGVTADFTPRDFSWVTSLPDDRPGSAFFGPATAIGTCQPGGDESGVLFLTSPPITLTGSSPARASFWHWLATELGFDGGNVSVSVNGGPFTVVPPGAMRFNNYNFFLVSAANGNTNPLAGQPSWTGTDGGAVDGSWGRTDVDLAALGANPGNTVQLRWNLGTDGCGGRFGWYVDDVSVYGCTAP